MKYIAALLPFLLSANAQDTNCDDERFGLKILDGPPRGDNDVFTDLPLKCEVEDSFVGGTYDCRELRQISRARCEVEVTMPVKVSMAWEIKNNKPNPRALVMSETWVDFNGPAVEGGTYRVTPTFTDLQVGEGGIAYIPGGETKTLGASAVVDKCQNSFNAKIRTMQRVSRDGVATLCPRRKVSKDLILRRCELENTVSCYVKGPSSQWATKCDTKMAAIRNASAEERGTLFAEEFCSPNSEVTYVYELCSESNLNFKHRPENDKKQTRAFLDYGSGEKDELSNVPKGDLAKGQCQEFKVILPAVECDGTEADPTSLFPAGIYDVNGNLKGQNQNQIDRKYTGCWERTSYEFDKLDHSKPESPADEPCTVAPTLSPTPAARKLEEADLMTGFVLPGTFKHKTKKCKGKGSTKTPSAKGSTKAPTMAPARRNH